MINKPGCKFKRYLSIAALVAIVWFLSFYFHTFNYPFSGYCMKENKTLTYKEITDRAITNMLKNEEMSGAPVSYSSLEEFYHRNPACCRFYSQTNSEARIEPLSKFFLFFEYHFGRLTEDVHEISITSRFERGGKERIDTYNVQVDSCGNLRDDIQPKIPFTSPVVFINGQP